MKNVFLLLFALVFVSSCKNKDKDAATPGGGSGTTGWQQLGGSLNLPQDNENIWAIATDASNNVYISPDYFGTNDWTPYKFSGTSWSKVGNLSSSDPLEHFQLQLDATGNLYLSNKVSAAISSSTGLTHIAKYDGNWSMVGMDNYSSVSGTSYEIPFVVLPSGKIYAGFNMINPSGYQNVVWDGANWTVIAKKYFDTITGDSVSCEMNDGVYRDANGNVYTQGIDINFSKLISKFNGTAWQSIGFPFAAGAGSSVYTSCFDAAGNVYFLIQSFSPDDYKICKWDGTAWTMLSKAGLPSGSNPLTTMAVSGDGHLYIAGNLINTSGNYYVAEYTGTSWQELGGDNTLKANGTIWALAVDTRGYVYAGGEFTNASGEAYVAMYKP